MLVHAAANNAMAVLQGQSNADFLNADENNDSNGGGWWSIFAPMVQSMTGIPNFSAQALRSEWSNPTAGYTIASNTATYDSTVSGGDSGLWLWANSASPASWPLGTHGQAAWNFLRANVYGQAPAGVPVALIRFHSEYDSKKNGTDAGYYAAANHNFVGQMRSAAGLSSTQMPVFYGSPCFWNGVNRTGLDTVRTSWLTEINNSANNAHWAFGAINDCNDRGDASHMDIEGDHQAAARMAFAYSRWLYDNGYAVNNLSSIPKLGPRITRFDRVAGAANQIDLTIQHDKGTDIVIPSGVRLDGFGINDPGSGSSPSVTAATRINTTTLRLTLSANLSSSSGITLDYLEWNGFYGPGTLITDNWHTSAVTKPSYVSSTVSAYYPNLKFPIRKLEKPLTIGVTDAGSLDDIPATVTIPPVPTGITAAAGNAQIAVSWSASFGAASYKLYRSTTAGGEGTTPIASGITTTSFTNTGLTNGTAYYYKVAAVNSAGTSSQSSEAHATPVAGSALASGTYMLTPGCATSRAMDADGAGTANPTRVHLWAKDGWDANRKWVVTSLGAGYYKIVGQYNTTMSLDDTAFSTTAGTIQELWSYSGGTNQQWAITSNGDGTYRISPACATSLYLTVVGNADADDANLSIDTYTGATGQKWTFSPA